FSLFLVSRSILCRFLVSFWPLVWSWMTRSSWSRLSNSISRRGFRRATRRSRLWRKSRVRSWQSHWSLRRGFFPLPFSAGEEEDTIFQSPRQLGFSHHVP